MKNKESNTTYRLGNPAAVDSCAEQFELVACDSGSSQESKCISTAISKFPLQASSKDFAIAFVAPVTLTNWSTRLAGIFDLAAILKTTDGERGKFAQPGRGKVKKLSWRMLRCSSFQKEEKSFKMSD